MSSIAHIREQIDELSPADRQELSAWLQETTSEEDDDEAYLQEGIALAEKRSEEMRTGKARLLSEEEFWAGVEQVKQQLRAS